MARNRPRKKKSRKMPDRRWAISVASGLKSKEEVTVELRTIPVCWGIPGDEILLFRFFTNFIMHMGVMPWDSFATSEGTYLPEARNVIHEGFLKDTDVPYLMMLDSDVAGPPKLLETLMAHDLPIVGGWYRNKKASSGFHPVVYDFDHEDEKGRHYRHRKEPGKGLEQVDGMGAGCWLMKREVAEALGPRPYSMFKNTEDLNLCYQLMKLEIPLHVDWSLACAHVGVGFV